MNVTEFAGLKAGDRIRNEISDSSGFVTEAAEHGVYVAWGGAEARPFYYSVQSTAWFQWSKVEPEGKPNDDAS